MSIMAIYHGSMTLFFGIRIKANPWFISHTVLSGLGFMVIVIVWFTYFTKNTTAKAFIKQRIFKPIRNLFVSVTPTFVTNVIPEVIQDEESEEQASLFYFSPLSYGSGETLGSKIRATFSTKKTSKELRDKMNRAYEPPFKYFVNEIEADQPKSTQK